MDEFILLFTTLQTITLTSDRDKIKWLWTGSREYTAASAYEAQFIGNPPGHILMEGKTEPKCRFFA